MSAEQQKLQSLSEEYQKLQTDLQANIQARQKLESQQQENKGVQREFASLDDDANIYKLVGPVLLKQDRQEATQTVDGRLEYIEKEIKRLDDLIRDGQTKEDKKKTEIYQLQVTMQQHQGGAQTAAAR